MLLAKIGVGLKLSLPHGHLKGQSQHGIDFREEVGGVEFGFFEFWCFQCVPHDVPNNITFYFICFAQS
jgi:hypothetical protein